MTQTIDRVDTDRLAVADVVVVGPTVDRSNLDGVVRGLLAAGVRALVLSEGPLDASGARLLLAGASGFLPIADTSIESLTESVLAVAGGSSALHPDVVSAVLSAWRANETPEVRPTSAGGTTGGRPELTAREADVLRGLAEGLTTRLLARRLGIAVKTVEAHKARLYGKLGARSQAHAVRIAADVGLLPSRTGRRATRDGPIEE